ncbi:hypothetical protein D6D01_04791 [Aureobasidium pullulans]|uniref:Uncharacterized protein n=1 Tax=Aureobasidium pullulans TaxID=5580 RepID=A0A4S9L9E0_AURPU|nr:hypothetical protein D6D01_04791 [Aureobasidium pullulans]
MSWAENYLARWCVFWPAGDSARMDELYEKLRANLDKLADWMRSNRPAYWIEHQLVWTEADAEDRDAEITKAFKEFADGENEDEEEEVAE